jgi:pimeloyl-ACP methyl ester carboxylesterase
MKKPGRPPSATCIRQRAVFAQQDSGSPAQVVYNACPRSSPARRSIIGKSRTFLERDHLVRGLFVKEFGPEGSENLDVPILMVPGGSHGWWAFEVWLPFFASAGWQSFSLSLRNHTGSYSLPDQEFVHLTLDEYVDDVSTVLKWLEKPAVLIGHSMGGIITQKVAEKMELKAMVLVASVGPGQLGAIRDPLPVDKPIMLDPDTVRRIWFHKIDDECFNSIYSRLTPESPEVINEYSTGRIKVDREAINCPILVIRGACDHTVVHRAEPLADFYSAPYQIEPDCGHDLMLEPPALDVAQKINQWLLSVVSTDREGDASKGA